MRAAPAFDCVVIGGGLAGLTSAVGLADAGLKPLVLEAGALLGGRARSWTDPTTGDPVHIGPHIFLSEYRNLLRLFDRLGTRDRIVWQPADPFITLVDGRRAVPIRPAPLPPPMHLVPSVLADPTTRLADKLSNVPLSARLLSLDDDQVLALDALPADTLLRQGGVSETYIRSFWSFVAQSILNVPLAECSAAALARFYRALIGTRGYRVGFPDRGLGDVFAPAARRVIEQAGGQVLTDTRVARFTHEGDRVTGVVTDEGRAFAAPHVVAALAPQDLDRLVRAPWRRLSPFRDLPAFEPSRYLCVYLWFDRKLTRRRFWARVYDPGDLNCDFYDYGNILRGPRDRPSLIASNIIYAQRLPPMDDAAIIARTRAELAEYLPAANAARLVHAVVHRVPMAIHCPRPGTERLRPATRTPIDGLLLAGDWIRTHLPASMESAVCAGWRAAEAVLADHGHHAALAAPAWRLPRAPRIASRVLADLLRAPTLPDLDVLARRPPVDRTLSVDEMDRATGAWLADRARAP
ncbi:MAG: FAD-dependent oxidoreductase [Myxococcales bacterium]|nr:FAD-dependent oxidoreductase [Myxococcales bacterium]